MTKIKRLLVIMFFSLFLLLNFSFEQEIDHRRYDFGPKPASHITITGIEGEYVVAFAAKSTPPNSDDYDSLLKDEDYLIKYNPICSYSDEEGYYWISHYIVATGETKISIGYYCPNEFKIIVYKNDELYAATNVLERYAYTAYYELDYSNYERGNPNTIKVIKNYDYLGEFGGFLLRVVATLLIELALFFVFKLYTKRNLIAVGTTNIVTQIGLNIAVNVVEYQSGRLNALLLLFTLEAIILIVELIAYQILLKDKKRWIVLIYSILANALSFGLGLLIYVGL